ncbi:MAG: endonuclease/exonuclease/phosphatase family protein [Deltaproteobacteria bacterium]|nr:endonuclease/exonuclease/phosphatase family protein [Deltaproteobacteria bacterium]
MRRAHVGWVLAAVVGCVSADDEAAPLSPPDPVTLMTLNAASGAGDTFRTTESRVKQGAFVARSAAEVVGLQEVDVGADRSGNLDVVASVAAAVAPGFGSCTFAVPEAPHMRRDGTRLARCEAGTLVFGVGFRADDPFSSSADGTPGGIHDADDSLNPRGVDRGADAFYGNAVIVRAPWEVQAAYTVALPTSASGPSLPPSVLDRLAVMDPDDDALDALAAHNATVRRGPAIEPRSALVVRVRKSSTTAVSVITTHLEASRGPMELRRAQLEAVAAIARAEQRKSAHHVVAMGDFNMPPADVQPSLAAAGLVRAAPPEPSADIDQMWVDPAFAIDGALRVPTENVTDHASAAQATLRALR